MSFDDPSWEESQAEEEDEDESSLAEFEDDEDDEDDEADLLADGTLDPDEVDPNLDPWDEGADDEV
jgi:hypothetical protein